MSSEDDRYGPPTHMCKYCNRCFPATWDESEGETRLVVDLLFNGAEAKLAAGKGCNFFDRVVHSWFSGALKGAVPVGLVIDRKHL